MEEIAGILVPISVCVVLPVLIVYFILKSKTNLENNRKEIVLAALEKNADIDIESLVRQMNPPEKLLKEKLLQTFRIGCVLTFVGAAVLLVVAIACFAGGAEPIDLYWWILGGFVVFGVGIAYLISYRVGKRMLAKEMEAEEASKENGER